jgi:hypothetical protein
MQREGADRGGAVLVESNTTSQFQYHVVMADQNEMGGVLI